MSRSKYKMRLTILEDCYDLKKLMYSDEKLKLIISPTFQDYN